MKPVEKIKEKKMRRVILVVVLQRVDPDIYQRPP